MKYSVVKAFGAALACVLAGCSSPESTASNAPAGGGNTSAASDKPAKQITLGFSQIGAESNWRKANTTSIQDAAKDAGITLDFSDAQQKQENQIKAIKSF